MKTIDSILRQTVHSWELIVVAQGNEPGLMSLLEKYQRADKRIHIVHQEWRNASNARNVGVAASRGDVIAFTDDDCEVAPDWVEVISSVFTTRQDVHFLGGEVVAPPSTRRWTVSTCPAAHVIDAVYVPSEAYYRAPHGFYMIGANIALRRSAWDKIGSFDTTLGPGTNFPSCEDVDLGIRAESLNVTMMTSRRLIVFHTAGRRYGMRTFLQHQINYARGRGAFLAKLQMADHRLGSEWGQPTKLLEHVSQIVAEPHRWLLGRFAGHHSRIAMQEYRAAFELGPNFVCRPKSLPYVGVCN